MQSYMGDGFVRFAQAVAILDHLLRQLQALDSVDEKIRFLQSLDEELQIFLAAAMDGYKLPGHHCGAIAVAIR